MSSSDSDSGPGQREVAYRLFAAEFDDSELSYSESDEERAPNYVVTPTGARINRLFAVGVLTEVEDVNPEMIRGRIVDPTGAFVTYAGQYQPDALAFFERADPPAFLALSGKARTYEPEDGDRIYTSVRPESVSEVDADTRDKWIVTAADRTLERIGIMASAIESGLVGDQLRAALIDAGVDDRLADGVALALDYYGTTPAYLDALRNLAIDAVEVVAGQRDEVSRLDLSPDEGVGDAGSLSTLDLSGAPSPQTATGAADVSGAEDSGETGTVDVSETESEAGSDLTSTEDSATADDSAETEPERDESAAEGVSDPDVETTAESSSEPSSAVESESTSPADTTPDLTDDTADTSAEIDDPGDFDESGEETDDFDPDEFDPSEFELDEEERREVEEEYGTEFSTADEVEPAESLQNEAASEPEETASEPEETAEDPDVDSTDSVAESTDSSEDEGEGSDAESPATEETDTEAPVTEETDEAVDPSDEAVAAPDENVNIEDAVMAAMEDLDDGDGVDHDKLVQTVVDEHECSADDVEGAIQDALMGGRCYEPSDGTLKSI